MRVGFVGLGAMGMGMSRNLHRAGLLSAVWNRTSEKAKALATELGCKAPATLEELAADVDAVVICVSADNDVLAVVRALAKGLRKGALVIDCSTIGADTARTASGILQPSIHLGEPSFEIAPARPGRLPRRRPVPARSRLARLPPAHAARQSE